MGARFRFGYQLSQEDESSPVAVAHRAEELGFDVVLVSDHVGPGLSPLVALSAIAQATERIRLGTLVVNNDMRNPVQLAWEAATLDHLSEGRFELGVGAGHTPQEYAATGIRFEHPRHRKARLMESVEVIRRLVDGEVVTYHGEHVHVDEAQIDASHQKHLPILVGGNGAALLGHAGTHADIVGLQGLGRTRPDGHRHAVKWDPSWLTAQIDQVRNGAGTRFADLELNALVQVTQITDDRPAVLGQVCERIEGLTVEHADAIPYLLIGTVDEIVEKVLACHARWGISYFVVGELETFAPVVAAFG
jgi:probable F420-dependent oxidoreductase